ncbi:MAG: DUF3800 domain-containing protein [Candidatus Diapherotrites archaeon]|nr:DUF3800 domain-containing protein [Candidatus Diapherotrites archaeon]
MEYIFIDESGDLGDKGSRFFVLAALLVKDPKPLDRIIKNLRRHKFKKQLSKAVEIKATDSSPELVSHFISKINLIQNAEVVFVVLDKKKNFSKFLHENKHKLYNFVAGKLANNLSLLEDVTIVVDKSKGSAILRTDFNHYFANRLCNGSFNCKSRIIHGNSFNFSGLQAVDCLAWACFQKFEFNNLNYLEAVSIKSSIIQVW